MQARALQNSTTNEESATPLAMGDYSAHALRQADGDATQPDGSKNKAHAHAQKQCRPPRFGLPCAKCKAYYDSDLPACPICNCADRVPAQVAEAKAADRLKNPSADVLRRTLGSFLDLDPTPPCPPPMQLALHCDQDGEHFLLESKLLLCAHTDEIDAGHTSLCILDENHRSQSEYALICLSCYERLRERLARTEAALLMDLPEAAQIVYEAVWADPSPAEPSRTYQSAAQALLHELCHRAGIARPSGAA